MIVVNFKQYKKTFGDFSLELADVCFKLSKETGVKIIPIVSPFFVSEISKRGEGVPWIGHVDAQVEEKRTGYVTAQLAKIMGAGGSLLSHSEHPLKLGNICRTLAQTEKDFEYIVCVKSLGQAERLLKKARPKYIAYEPPYLISSKTASIATERIEVFEKIVELGKTKGVEVLAGAGVKDKSDVVAVKKAGGSGVLVSSAVVLGSDPRAVLLDLIAGFGV